MQITKHTISLIFTIIILMVLILWAKLHFDEAISDVFTILPAFLGVVAILYQLRKDYKLSKAGFVYSLNDTFSQNKEITYIYNRLKEYRDKDNIDFSEDDGRRMGDYVMYFEIMGYLLEEGLISIDMVDSIFANKFFLFVNNPYTQKYQLKYSQINKPLLELYCKWYNYRIKAGKKELYPKYSLKEYDEYFIQKNKVFIALNPKKMEIGYD